jgi:uncharacterized membrane protein
MIRRKLSPPALKSFPDHPRAFGYSSSHFSSGGFHFPLILSFVVFFSLMGFSFTI